MHEATGRREFWVRVGLDGAIVATRQTTTHQRASFAVVYIDLDGFKTINDTEGHDAGDAVLIEAARRLEGVILDGGKAGRIGGDEFAVLLSSATTEPDAARVAQDLLSQLETPFAVGNGTMTISASMGIAMAAPASPRTPEQLSGPCAIEASGHDHCSGRAAMMQFSRRRPRSRLGRLDRQGSRR